MIPYYKILHLEATFLIDPGIGGFSGLWGGDTPPNGDYVGGPTGYWPNVTTVVPVIVAHVKVACFPGLDSTLLFGGAEYSLTLVALGFGYLPSRNPQRIISTNA
mmetsp:Transcript_11289/g.20304  ORF Transcript_11289/g.20304 Transcript_11289/m.20304 type:complete len:104 (+) Transcript_11289:1427-1738(+)